MLSNDPRRCDYRRDTDRDSDQTAPDTGDDSDPDTDDDSSGVPLIPPLIQAPIQPTPLLQLSRRRPFDQARALALRCGYCIESVDEHLTRRARNFLPIQDKWDDMLQQRCKDQYSEEFWKFFLDVHTFSRVVIDTALAGVRKMPFFPAGMERQFPANKRVLMRNLDCIPKFWKLVRHSYRIDVSQFNLESGTTYLDFTFIDPIWGWLMAARRHPPADLYWYPVARHRTSPPVYGGGIQYGDCMRHARVTLPEGSFPMFYAVHWDGTFGRGLEVVPIAVGVANINNCDKSKETCIGYVPVTPDQKRPEFRKTEKSTK